LVIVVLTISSMERDGAGVLAGYGIFIGMIVYFLVWAKVIAEAFVRIADKLGF